MSLFEEAETPEAERRYRRLIGQYPTEDEEHAGASSPAASQGDPLLVRRLKAELEAHEDLLKMAEERIGELCEQREELSAELTAAKLRCEPPGGAAAAAAVAAAQLEVTSLQASLAAEQQRRERAERQVAALRASLAAAEQQLEALSEAASRQSQLEREAATLRHQVEAHAAAVAEAQRQRDAAQRQAASLQASVASSQRQLDVAEAARLHAESAAHAAGEQVESVRRAAVEQLAALHSQLGAARSEAAALRGQLAAAESDAAALRSQLHEVQAARSAADAQAGAEAQPAAERSQAEDLRRRAVPQPAAAVEQQQQQQQQQAAAAPAPELAPAWEAEPDLSGMDLAALAALLGGPLPAGARAPGPAICLADERLVRFPAAAQRAAGCDKFAKRGSGPFNADLVDAKCDTAFEEGLEMTGPALSTNATALRGIVFFASPYELGNKRQWADFIHLLRGGCVLDQLGNAILASVRGGGGDPARWFGLLGRAGHSSRKDTSCRIKPRLVARAAPLACADVRCELRDAVLLCRERSAGEWATLHECALAWVAHCVGYEARDALAAQAALRLQLLELEVYGQDRALEGTVVYRRPLYVDLPRPAAGAQAEGGGGGAVVPFWGEATPAEGAAALPPFAASSLAANTLLSSVPTGKKL